MRSWAITIGIDLSSEGCRWALPVGVVFGRLKDDWPRGSGPSKESEPGTGQAWGGESGMNVPEWCVST